MSMLILLVLLPIIFVKLLHRKFIKLLLSWAGLILFLMPLKKPLVFMFLNKGEFVFHKRGKMSKRFSRRAFKRGNRIHKKNFRHASKAGAMRGGIRL